MKIKSFSKLRGKALSYSAGTLNGLASHDKSAFFRSLYALIKCIWEIISPSKVYKVVSSDSFAEKQGSGPIIVKKNRKGYAVRAEIIGRNSKPSLEEFPLRDIKLYLYNNVFIHHGSDFVFDKTRKLAVNDYCALKTNPNQGYEDDATYCQVGKIAIIKNPNKSTSLKSGIMISGKFSYNYYHNLYENLIRLLVLEENNSAIPKNVPIIIDEEVYQIASVKRIFEILSDSIKREVVILKKGQTIYFEELYIISPINKIVPVLFDLSKGCIEDCLFDREYTQKLRDRLLMYREKCDYPKRFFISRRNTKHRNFNEDEVFSVLEPLGFEKIAPEEFSFEQQMSLFSQAEWIISGPGAALTNLLFSSSCIVICLYEEVPYIPAVFSAPASFNNTRVVYFLSGKKSREISAHTENFIVDIEQFKEFVKECILPAL